MKKDDGIAFSDIDVTNLGVKHLDGPTWMRICSADLSIHSIVFPPTRIFAAVVVFGLLEAKFTAIQVLPALIGIRVFLTSLSRPERPVL